MNPLREKSATLSIACLLFYSLTSVFPRANEFQLPFSPLRQHRLFLCLKKIFTCVLRASGFAALLRVRLSSRKRVGLLKPFPRCWLLLFCILPGDQAFPTASHLTSNLSGEYMQGVHRENPENGCKLFYLRHEEGVIFSLQSTFSFQQFLTKFNEILAHLQGAQHLIFPCYEQLRLCYEVQDGLQFYALRGIYFSLDTRSAVCPMTSAIFQIKKKKVMIFFQFIQPVLVFG